MRMVAEFCTLIDRQRADLVQANNGSAVLVGRRLYVREHCVTNLKTKSHFRGRHGRNAACGIYAQGWRARAIDMMRPNMKKGNSATSLLAACALSLSLSFLSLLIEDLREKSQLKQTIVEQRLILLKGIG